MSAMEIGLFQLENLTQTPTLFVYLDLRQNPADTPLRLKPILHRSVAVQPADVKSYLQKNKIPTSAPIVLLCEDGKTSQQVASDLMRAGHVQVYVVCDGVAGLTLEL